MSILLLGLVPTPVPEYRMRGCSVQYRYLCTVVDTTHLLIPIPGYICEIRRSMMVQIEVLNENDINQEVGSNSKKKHSIVTECQSDAAYMSTSSQCDSDDDFDGNMENVDENISENEDRSRTYVTAKFLKKKLNEKMENKCGLSNMKILFDYDLQECRKSFIYRAIGLCKNDLNPPLRDLDGGISLPCHVLGEFRQNEQEPKFPSFEDEEADKRPERVFSEACNVDEFEWAGEPAITCCPTPPMSHLAVASENAEIIDCTNQVCESTISSTNYIENNCAFEILGTINPFFHAASIFELLKIDDLRNNDNQHPEKKNDHQSPGPSMEKEDLRARVQADGSRVIPLCAKSALHSLEGRATQVTEEVKKIKRNSGMKYRKICQGGGGRHSHKKVWLRFCARKRRFVRRSSYSFSFPFVQRPAGKVVTNGKKDKIKVTRKEKFQREAKEAFNERRNQKGLQRANFEKRQSLYEKGTNKTSDFKLRYDGTEIGEFLKLEKIGDEQANESFIEKDVQKDSEKEPTCNVEMLLIFALMLIRLYTAQVGERSSKKLHSILAQNFGHLHTTKQQTKRWMTLLARKMEKRAMKNASARAARYLAIFLPHSSREKSNQRRSSRKRRCIVPKEMFRSMLRKRRKALKQEGTLKNDGAIIVNTGRISEPANIELAQPPTTTDSEPSYRDEVNRIRSFRDSLVLQSQAQVLARSGLYLNQYNIVKCFRCQRQQQIAEIGDRSRWHFPNCCFHSAHSFREDLDDVVADTPGRVSDDIGDPPGQQSVYVPPGDVRSESYRLSTFEHFPVTCPISRKSLAKSGFYFTGFYDRVKCFVCGRTVERWEATDNPAELRWHKPDCRYPRGDPCGNVPMNSLFERLHTNPITRQQQAQQQQEQVLTQTDPNTGAVIRTVRYPADLPDRIRRTGGTFQIGPGNSVIIQSGPGSRPNPAIHIGNQAAPPPPRRWRMANVVTGDHRRFVTNLYLNRELDRLTSFARWPVSRPNVSPASLAKTGFFYLGDMDRTQCFSCGGVLRNWTLEDDPQEEHRTHFPSCAMVQRTEIRNVPVPEDEETPEDRMRLYPCRHPASPHMRSEANRLGTFDDRWPAERIGATPAVIAEAGFFYLGERDRVKCWYCNGGLQNWEYEDLPWQEHAKWFPNCQFLLQTKGQLFIYRNLAMNPHLARPIIARQEGATIDPGGNGEEERAQDVPGPGLPGPRQPSPPPTIIDPQEEMRKKKQRIENIMKTSEVCKNVLMMGFSPDAVRRLLEERIDAGTEANSVDIYESASALLEDVMKKEAEMLREAEEEEVRNQASMMSSMSSVPSTNPPSITGSSIGPAFGSGRYNVSFYDEDEPMDDQNLYESIDGAPRISVIATGGATGTTQVKQIEDSSESLQEQLQKIEEERMCKICFSNVADMVFVPCSHMCCCMDCTQAIRQCPVCRTKIEKAIKTYLK